MAKGLKTLIGVLAVLLVVTTSALAQDEPSGSTPAQSPSPESPPGETLPAETSLTEDTVTFSFEVTVKGEVPEGTTLLGFIPAEGGFRAPLEDPDSNGVYTAA